MSSRRPWYEKRIIEWFAAAAFAAAALGFLSLLGKLLGK